MNYLRHYKIGILASFLLSALSVALMLYVPILIGRAIDSITKEGVNFSRIFVYMVEIPICVLVSSVAQWGMNVINNRITFQVVQDIRGDIFSKIQSMPLIYLDKQSTGDLVSRMITDVEQFAEGLLMGFTQLFTGVLTILGTLIFMLLLNVKIALVVVCCTPLSLVVASFIAKKTYTMFQKQTKSRGQLTSFLDERIEQAKVVQAFGQEGSSKETFHQMNEELRDYSLQAIFYSSVTNPATRFVNAIIYAIVGVWGCFSVLALELTVGGLTSFLSYANQYTKPFNEISAVITELQNALACANRIFEFLEEQSEDYEGKLTLESIRGEVRFQDVSFSYQRNQPFIKGLSFQAQRGEKVAIVGPTGCGKTTIINLLMGFYGLDQGNIFIDGKNSKELSKKSLRKAFGMVLQDTWLKEGTIFENLRVGKEDATKEEMVAACKEAYAHSFIKRLPNGYETRIKADGGSLSQGQKQLLCIARVMLSNPPMLILDEATSSIDTLTEQKIQKAFMKVMEGKTSFIVAHRLSTIQKADKILVMKEGKIIQQGNHATLIREQGFYKILYKSQFA